MAVKATRNVSSSHQFQAPATLAASPTAAQVTAAVHATNPGQDLIQIINSSGKIVFCITSVGVAMTNPSAPTSFAHLGRYEGSSVAVLADSSGNDIYQVLGPGGNVLMHISSDGVVHTP